MNKKGFTLIEVIISLVLISVVLTSMLATLVKIREIYSTVNENTDALIYSSSVSRILNNDIIENGGIRYVDCNIEGDRCDIILSNGKERSIIIYSNEVSKEWTKGCLSGFCDEKTTPKKDLTVPILCDSIPLCKEEINAEGKKVCIDGEFFCPIKNIVTTLKYVDTTNNGNDTIYLKSLKATRNYNYVKGRTYSDGYTFGKMTYNTYDFNSVTQYEISPSGLKLPYRNAISSINIEINDMIDVTDNTYGIAIYSSASFSPGMNIGDQIKLIFDNRTVTDIMALAVYDEELVVKYGVNFNIYYKDADGNKHNTLIETTKITIPQVTTNSGKTYTFDGYYYISNEGTSSEKEIDVIDKNGNILATNTFFIKQDKNGDGITDDIVLYARWKAN